jgi:two-component system, chemotaxis family, response regulator Rcp1
MEAPVIHIWVVEDNDADVLLLREALDEQALRYELTVFGNGEEALRFVDEAGTHSACPDLLILDLHLPKVDGPEVLRRFRANADCLHTPVLILSSLVAPQERIYIERFSGVSIQDKPMDLDGYSALGRRIKALLLLSAKAQ